DWSETALVQANTFPLPNSTTNTYLLNGSTLSTTSSGGRASVIHPNQFGPALFAPIENILGSNTNALVTALAAANIAINSGGDVLDARVATGSDDDATSASFTTPALGQDLHALG